MINLRCYKLAIEIYSDCKAARLPTALRDQLMRASSSVVLNLAEGYGKATPRDRMRFFAIAFGSIREVQAICDIEPLAMSFLTLKVDYLAASVYKLQNSK